MRWDEFLHTPIDYSELFTERVKELAQSLYAGNGHIHPNLRRTHCALLDDLVKSFS